MSASSSEEALPAVPARPPADARLFLAFDFGERRTGVAIGNTLSRQARALHTLAVTGDARFQAVGALVAEWQPAALVVGIPFHPDGAEHGLTQRARRFARQLQARFRLPVHEVDERYSSVEAARGDTGRGGLDAEAAAVILQQFLDGPDT